MFFKESRISTPDLRDKFIKCAESFDLSAEKIGGGGNSGVKNMVKLALSNLPTHSHSINFNNVQDIDFTGASGTITLNSGGAHNHKFKAVRVAANRRTRKGIEDADKYGGTPDSWLVKNAHITGEHTHSFNKNVLGKIRASIKISGATEKIGEAQSFNIEPQYYALMYIMKIRNN